VHILIKFIIYKYNWIISFWVTSRCWMVGITK